jgi:agmatinase
VSNEKSLPTEFDPDAAAAQDSGIFGLPSDPETAAVHVIPVPFDATTSYRKGTAGGPDAVLRASRQVDLYDVHFGRFWRKGIAYIEADPRIARSNSKATERADRVIAVGGRIEGRKGLARDLERVNAICAEVNEIVRGEVDRALGRGKLPALLGGDHSTPFGAIQAVAERHPGVGVLHFDAHADLRQAYEGFTWSHASILHNVVTRLDGVSKVVHVGIRDFGERELELIQASKGRVVALFDADWARAKFEGANLRELVRKTIAHLPKEIYVTFDVDGLDPTLCPNTGTPVPGGFSWHEAVLWIEEIAKSGRRVLGVDLNEVSPGATDDEVDSWDAIVGARLLYKLIGAALATRG